MNFIASIFFLITLCLIMHDLINYKYQKKYHSCFFIFMYFILIIILLQTKKHIVLQPLLMILGFSLILDIGCLKHDFSIFMMDVLFFIFVYTIKESLFILNVFFGIDSYFYTIIICITLLLFAYFYKIKQNSLFTVPRKESFIYISLSLISILLLYIFSLQNEIIEYHLAKNTVSYILFGQVMILFFVVVLVYYYINYVARSNRYENLLNQIEIENEYKQKYYETLKNKQDELSKIIHDVKNHLLVINNLNSMQATSISKDLIDDLDRHHIKKYSNSNILNIILINHQTHLLKYGSAKFKAVIIFFLGQGVDFKIYVCILFIMFFPVYL